MSPILFYLALVFFSGGVEFSLFWSIIALVAGGSETVVHRYRYTADPGLEGKDVSS